MLIRLNCLLLTALVSIAPGSDVIDRVLAVVDRAIITQSDVLVAMRLGLGRLPGERAAATEAAALEHQIERRLMLTEVDRYAPPEPPAAEIDRRLESVGRLFTSEAELQRVLEQVGLTAERLRRIVREDLRLETYLDQRFGAAVQPTDEDLVAYYRAHLDRFSAGGTPRPFAEVRDDVRTALVGERRPAQIANWLSGLRRRADIVILATQSRIPNPHPSSLIRLQSPIPDPQSLIASPSIAPNRLVDSGCGMKEWGSGMGAGLRMRDAGLGIRD